jgi:hypothetical protein
VPDEEEVAPPVDADAPLSTEALRSASDLMREQLEQHPIPPTLQGPKRRPGRPPGSKNRAKEGQVTPPSSGPRGASISVPRGASSRVDIPVDQATLQQKAAAKKVRAEELAGKISGELNETILSLFMSMGVPTDFLYKEGRAPKSAPVNSPYTDLGAKLAISPMAATAMARFAAELEATDVGTKISGTAQGSSTLPLIISGVFALGAGLQYAKGVQEVLAKMQVIMEAKRAYEESQAQGSGEANAG